MQRRAVRGCTCHLPRRRTRQNDAHGAPTQRVARERAHLKRLRPPNTTSLRARRRHCQHSNYSAAVILTRSTRRRAQPRVAALRVGAGLAQPWCSLAPAHASDQHGDGARLLLTLCGEELSRKPWHLETFPLSCHGTVGRPYLETANFRDRARSGELPYSALRTHLNPCIQSFTLAAPHLNMCYCQNITINIT